MASTDDLDDLDDLFNHDAMDDVFDRPLDVTRPSNAIEESSARSRGTASLGLDEAIEVTRKARAPKPKLDADLLLSTRGIPKLRERAKKLKLKGKSHEYADAARMLQMYQVWLDDLFPKAEFLDALKMVEKQGHKKQMQGMRTQWINQAPSGDSSMTDDDPALFNAAGRAISAPVNHGSGTGSASLNNARASSIARTPNAPNEVHDTTHPVDSTLSTSDHEDMPDDLDALLLEADMNDASEPHPALNPGHVQEVDFDDDMEAMAQLEGHW